MKKYILDFVFDEKTGTSDIVIDFHDESMNSLEINEGIRDGSLQEELLSVVEDFFGEEIAENVRNKKIGMICLDNQPKKTENKNENQEITSNSSEENTL